MEKQKIKLLASQKMLLQMKAEKVQEAMTLVQVRQKEVQAILNLVMIEVGVPKDELNQWKLSEDEQAIEKIEILNKEEEIMNKKKCPKCEKFMVAWGGQRKNQSLISVHNIWKCACGHEEVYEPNLPSVEELFQKKWKEANKK